MEKFPYPEYLNHEEVNYELLIRGHLDENVAALDLANKQRHLRALMKDDMANGKNYPSPYNIMEEHLHIEGRVTDLLKAIKRQGLERRYVSRVLHYWYRAKRTVARDEEEKRIRRELIRGIENCMKEYKIGPPSSPFIGRINEMLTEADNMDIAQDQLGAQGSSTPKNPRETGAIPKVPKQNSTEVGEKQNEETQKKIEYLERMVENMSRLLEERKSNERSVEKKRETEQTVAKSRRSGFFSRDNSRSSDEEEEEDAGNYDRHYERAQLQRQASEYDSESSVLSHRHSDRVHSWSGQNRRQPRNHQRDHGIRDHLNRVEKWKIRFTGDSRTVSVENFLYKLEKIAEREGVTKRQLLRDVHLLLDGPASDWFFTFVDEFDDWSTFDRLIKYRFGNPNQDQGIRQKMQERKQHRGETFIAFVTEIEKLNRMLSKPLSRTRKFELISDNMRQHYRSKISIVEVRDLQQLVKLNHRIDAADPSLHLTGEPRRAVNNVEVARTDYDSDESATVNVMRPHFTKENNQTIAQNTPKNPPNQPRTGYTDTATKYVCWNCQQQGHGWRECTRAKVIFCYGCGNLGRTIRCCERCSTINRRQANQEN